MAVPSDQQGGSPPPPPQPVRAGSGPIGQQQSVGTVILLSIVTLGIYYLFWAFKRHEEIKLYSGNGVGGMVGVLIAVFVGFVTPFLMSGEIDTMYKAEGRQSPVNAMTGLWILLPIVGFFIWISKAQSALNDFWGSKGAPAPK